MKSDKQKRKILLTDDEEMNIFLLESYINSMHDDIVFLYAHNGSEAVNICKIETVDLIFMDIKMPIMDGYEATGRIKQINPGIPVVAQSAYCYENRQEIITLFDDFLSKPIQQIELNNLINKYLA